MCVSYMSNATVSTRPSSPINSNKIFSRLELEITKSISISLDFSVIIIGRENFSLYMKHSSSQQSFTISSWVYATKLATTMRRVLVIATVTLLVCSTTTHQSALTEFSGVLRDIVALGTEDVKWSDYGDFGLMFAPAEHLVERAGFKYKMYHPVTEDGYTIELIHMINPLADSSKLKKVPVILSHGFTQAGYNFICQSITESKALKWPRRLSEKWNKASDRNLAVLLANNGYDVWLATSRGSLSSTKGHMMKLHTSHSVHDPAFWRFNLDDQAKYDIPCQVDTVREITNASKVIFVGYSQSTFTMFGQLSSNPQFARKVHTFVAVAPITTMMHDTGLLRPIGRMVKTLVPEAFRDFSFPPMEMGRMATKFCFLIYSIMPKMTQTIVAFCYNLFFGDNGNKAFDGMILLGRLMRYPTSFRGFIQFMQLQFVDRMTHYDFGTAGNMRHYGTPLAPPYNTSAIELDGIVAYIGEKDCLSMPEDNKVWVDSLKHPPIEYKVIPGWNHLDYVIGRNNDILMNRPILRILDKRVRAEQLSQKVLGSHEPTHQDITVTNPQSVASQLVNPQLANTQSIASQLVNPQLANSQSVVSRFANSQLANSQSVASQFANSHLENPQSISSQFSNSELANPQSVSSQSANSHLANSPLDNFRDVERTLDVNQSL